jgi:hypothetical protein
MTEEDASFDEVRIVDRERITWLRDHAGLLVTLFYAFLIIVGVVYEALLLLRFRVNILYYAEAADFLLVPFREPLVTIAAVAPIPLWMLYIRMARKLEKRFSKPKPDQRLSVEAARKLRVWVSLAGMCLWSLAATMSYANRVSGQILDGKRRIVRVDFMTGGTVSGPVIASTSRWLFIWDAATQHTRVVPTENVAQLVVFRTSRKARKPTTIPPVSVRPAGS